FIPSAAKAPCFGLLLFLIEEPFKKVQSRLIGFAIECLGKFRAKRIKPRLRDMPKGLVFVGSLQEVRGYRQGGRRPLPQRGTSKMQRGIIGPDPRSNDKTRCNRHEPTINVELRGT